MRVIIIIKKWETYNPRSDLKSMSWFRVQANIAVGQTLFGLPVDAKWLWISILSLAAAKNENKLEVGIDYLSHVSGVDRDSIHGYLKEFSSLFRDLIELIDDPVQITNESERVRTESERVRTESERVLSNPIENVPYETRRDVTNVTNEDNEDNKKRSASSSFLILELESLGVTRETIEKWKKQYKESFIQAQFDSYKLWAKDKKNIKRFESIFDTWLADNFKKTKKVNPELDANAAAWARYAYSEIQKNKKWIGDSGFDASVFLNLDKEISSEKFEAIKQLKIAYLETYLSSEVVA